MSSIKISRSSLRHSGKHYLIFYLSFHLNTLSLFPFRWCSLAKVTKKYLEPQIREITPELLKIIRETEASWTCYSTPTGSSLWPTSAPTSQARSWSANCTGQVLRDQSWVPLFKYRVFHSIWTQKWGYCELDLGLLRSHRASMWPQDWAQITFRSEAHRNKFCSEPRRRLKKEELQDLVIWGGFLGYLRNVLLDPV